MGRMKRWLVMSILCFSGGISLMLPFLRDAHCLAWVNLAFISRSMSMSDRHHVIKTHSYCVLAYCMLESVY